MTDSLSDLREAVWTFTNHIIPSAPLHLQESLLNIVWLMNNFFLSQEESEMLYLKIFEIWDSESLEIDQEKELLAWCAWKLRLYLLFDQKQTALHLFRELMKSVRRGISEQELLRLCSDSSTHFPLPKISEEDTKSLFRIAEVFQAKEGSITIKQLADLMHLTKGEVIDFLTKFEITFGCMVAAEALGLYHLYAEVEVQDLETLPQLLEYLKPFVIRCAILSGLQQSPNNPRRLSFRFYYPIEKQDRLFDWAIKNKIRLYRQSERHIYQNFNVLLKEFWFEKKTTEMEEASFQITLENSIDQIKLTRDILQIVETYLITTFFSKAQIPQKLNHLIPYSKLSDKLGLREEWSRHMAAKLFSKRVLVRYFYISHFFRPSFLLKGPELVLHTEAKKYLYARLESYIPFNNEIMTWERQKVYQLYSLSLSPELLQKYPTMKINRVFESQPPVISARMYDFDKS
ncbi:MAG: hypothetical protein ACFFCQ_14880, partial [Promethearchaeota archaeon]